MYKCAKNSTWEQGAKYNHRQETQIPYYFLAFILSEGYD
ncbi:hypothetical protein DFP76_101289 [Marinomonas aquiplantarum]|uniref:Uncharacterized protein n=1 Tax=Marinomonas aquiplantarum TaxID=491951 RepID=A0A366D7K4_9GAMM|nr:hypothetical protein DFP76_101289 [Marinomonas aquiplantarum]